MNESNPPDTGVELDLALLWNILEKHKETMEEKENMRNNIDISWELLVAQVTNMVVRLCVSYCEG